VSKREREREWEWEWKREWKREWEWERERESERQRERHHAAVGAFCRVVQVFGPPIRLGVPGDTAVKWCRQQRRCHGSTPPARHGRRLTRTGPTDVTAWLIAVPAGPWAGSAESDSESLQHSG
jgi:hypothetical protein